MNDWVVMFEPSGMVLRMLAKLGTRARITRLWNEMWSVCLQDAFVFFTDEYEATRIIAS